MTDKVDVNIWMTQGSSTVARYDPLLTNDNWILSDQVDRKILVHLREFQETWKKVNNKYLIYATYAKMGLQWSLTNFTFSINLACL